MLPVSVTEKPKSLFFKFSQHPAVVMAVRVLRQFWQNQGVINASALTYTTLFAVVPLMTVMYAMLAAIPSFSGVGEQIQAWVFDNFVPSTGDTVQDYLAEFSQQARSLTAIGVAALAVTSIMMIKNIEAAFNRIWRITQPRKGISSFLLYWAVLSLGPILVGLGLVISSYLASLSIISSATDLVGKAQLIKFLPAVMSTAAFTLIYVAVPNCRVPIKSALVGGFVVAILFEMAKRGFAMFVTEFPSYQLIYGAFAAFPLFLLWIFVSWVIILMGCELTRALSIHSQRNGARGVEPHFTALLSILNLLWLSQKQGKAVSDKALFSSVPTLSQNMWDEYQVLLIELNLIQRTEQGLYLLCKDLNELNLHDFYASLPWPLPQSELIDESSVWKKRLKSSVQEVDSSRSSAFNYSVSELFQTESTKKLHG